MTRPISPENSAVIDTDCLIYLWKLDLLHKLVIRYNVVYIPKYVKEEFGRKGKIKRRFNSFLKEYKSFLEICEVGNFYDVQLLYDRKRNPKARIHRGEAEVIIQARERGTSDVLINDRKGKKVAESHTLLVKSIFDILDDFKKVGVIENTENEIKKIGLLRK
jgi:predicted nucleic acid-binding protein